jgi:hypothetical protein
MRFMVNSAPGAGYRFEPSATFVEAKDALSHAVELSARGMRSIKIRDTVTGAIFDEKSLRQSLSRTATAP